MPRRRTTFRFDPRPKTTNSRNTMSYRIRFTFPNGTTGVLALAYPTREAAQNAVRELEADTGLAYTVEEVAEPGSTAAHHVEILRDRVNELEALVATLRKKLNETLTDNDDIHRDLAFALDIGQAMREAMRHGAWGHDGEGHLASVSAGAWDRFKTNLAKAPSVPVGASKWTPPLPEGVRL
jgi:hypothetical protein